MSLSWSQRKLRLASLLKSGQGDEDAEGLALDRILHGQSIIGKTAKTTEIDAIRFSDTDLTVAGALEYGQFGVIYVVTCNLNGRVYVRKSIDKKFALRNRDQCSPQLERDILLQAHKTDSQWAPHLLCAFQTQTHLNLVMDYAEGGNLWDVLESSPLDGRVKESDLMWWAPQLVSAIHWCHSQGFVHRDIKPHNFVLTPDAHVLLIDFGSAAPLLPPDSTGAQKVQKRYCFIPCGTCDYISPEILQAHEEALVALEMDDGDTAQLGENQAYGRETDWWSLGAMLYEMAYGNAPFFAKDIRQTYLRIMDHKKYLRFNRNQSISPQYQDFLRHLLTSAEFRLGRKNVQEITDHPVFRGVDWTNLPAQQAPSDLDLPQFTYTEPGSLAPSPAPAGYQDETHSQGFAFSALFQSSTASSSPGLSILRSKSSPDPPRPIEEDATASFIGFSWGPTLDAFPVPQNDEDLEGHTLSYMDTPRPLRTLSTYLTPNSAFITPRFSAHATPRPGGHDKFTTPVRPSGLPPPGTLMRTGTVRRTGERRNVTDREAMKQLVDCVGMSARKKVLESGRKPRLLTRSGSTTANGAPTRKELRFTTDPIPIPSPNLVDTAPGTDSGAKAKVASPPRSRVAVPPKSILVNNHNQPAAWSGSEDTDSEDPPSPSPTPRPGSAMSILSRRSGTPTISSARIGTMGTAASTSTMLGVPTSASARSLSFSHSVDLTESFRSQLAEDRMERGKDRMERGKEREESGSMTSSGTYNEMEGRLASIMGIIRGVEEGLAKVATMLQ
ncbi:hypothetical protein C0995_007118 [Termitomyces sp. Mi166|nr:hypothetical protein C0995_007118 [Termitomyces sp. Mi166\